MSKSVKDIIKIVVGAFPLLGNIANLNILVRVLSNGYFNAEIFGMLIAFVAMVSLGLWLLYTGIYPNKPSK
ncbi:MAG TPA: hypothetical protein VF648_03085 [Pyrinomonadaceae bacterium]|jgi:hypothetical protein